MPRGFNPAAGPGSAPTGPPPVPILQLHRLGPTAAAPCPDCGADAFVYAGVDGPEVVCGECLPDLPDGRDEFPAE